MGRLHQSKSGFANFDQPAPDAARGEWENASRIRMQQPVHPPDYQETSVPWARDNANGNGHGTDVATSSVTCSAARCARSASARMVRTIANTARMAVSKTKGQSRRLICNRTGRRASRRDIHLDSVLVRESSPRRTSNPVHTDVARPPAKL